MSDATVPAPSRATLARHALLLLLLLLAVFATRPPNLHGDVLEYTLMTVAVAEHGTPDIRPADLDVARPLLPGFGAALDAMGQGLRERRQVPLSGFYRDLHGRAQALHFFAYSALAAAPFKLLRAAGLEPFKCYLALNLGFVFVLGLCLLRLFGSIPRALFGLLMFLLCGGVLYLEWSSPELMTASMLLSALLLYVGGAPLRAGLLGGLATLQNPTAVFLLAFAPLLQLCVEYRAERGLRAALRACLRPRRLLGLGLGAAIFALAPLFNLLRFGVPSLIAEVATDASLASGLRLFSFYFDLNQGMLVGVPALALFLLAGGWRGAAPAERRRRLLLLALAGALTVALALPTLVIQNWNSAAAGVMRYAFWAAMPLLFVLLWQLRERARWPRAALAALALLQLLAMHQAARYNELEFSPLARAVLRHAPALYHPEPEVFAERVLHGEIEMTAERVLAYEVDGRRLKTMYNRGNLAAQQLLCGAGRELAADNRTSDSSRLWRYVDGELRCRPAGAPPLRYRLEQFLAGDAVALGGGWSRPEAGGGIWNGSWSSSATSTLTLRLPAGPAHGGLLLIGRYFAGNRATRVRINGRDLGWQRLDELPPLPLPPLPPAALLTLELQHDAPFVPPAGSPDQRRLAFFLQEIALLPAGRPAP